MTINSATPSQTDWQFSGFAFPTTTPVPDQLFDELLHRLSGAELKVLLYIVRRTYGFKKQSDDISLAQLVNGIKAKDGKVLDRGTGLGKSSVTRVLNSLEEKHIIVRSRRQNQRQGYQATTYTLNIVTPLSQNETRGVPSAGQGLSHQRDTQQTVLQQTVLQQQQEQVKAAASGGGDKTQQNLAAALIDKGIKATVAKQLTRTYSRQRIEANLDWWAWKKDKDPTSIKINPAGLLRRAIEDDYASEGHHHGFQTRQQKAVVAAQQKQRLKQQQKLADERERQQQALVRQKELARAKRLEALRERYRSTAKVQKLWQEVLEKLRPEITPLKFNLHLTKSELLSLSDGQAVICVPTTFTKNWVEDNVSKFIQEALGQHRGGQIARLKIIALDKVE
jgi:DNA-binding MarR family transcriptional regulator